MKRILSKRLPNNPKIGLICPSGNIKDKIIIDKAVNYLSKKGCRVRLGKYLLGKSSKFDYLSGTDSQRVSDLENMFRDKTIDAVFCLRGGFGSTRILNTLDYEVIRKNPKIFVGYSDITALLLAIYKKTGLVTFHGPMFGTRFVDKNLNPKDKRSEKLFWNLLKSDDFNFSYAIKDSLVVIPGKVKGALLGGNLTLITSLIGTQHFPDFSDSILFIEDCGEEPYKIDRLLTHLDNAKVFEKINGLVIGTFDNCKFAKNSQVVELLKDKLSKYKIPTVYNFPIGHGKKNYILPVGLKVILDTKELTLKTI